MIPRIYRLVPALILLISPLAASAATPQSIFENAWNATFGQPKNPLRIGSNISFSVVSTNAQAKLTTTADFSGRFLYRRRGTSPAGRQDSEGQLIIDALRYKGIPSMSFTLTKPVQLEWKTVDRIPFARLKAAELPKELLSFVPALGDINGKWLDGTPEASTSSSTLFSNVTVTTASPSELSPQIFTVQRVESVKRGADGARMYRLRLVFNEKKFAALLAQKRQALKSSALTAKALADEDAKLVSEADDMRTYLSMAHVVAVVNEKTNTVTRVEATGRIVNDPHAPKGDARKGTFSVEMNVLKDGNWTVVKPNGDLPLGETLLGVMLQVVFGGMQATAKDMESGALPMPVDQSASSVTSETLDKFQVTDVFGKTISYQFSHDATGQVNGNTTVSMSSGASVAGSYLKEGWDAGMKDTHSALSALGDVHTWLTAYEKLKAENALGSSVGVYVSKKLKTKIEALKVLILPDLYTTGFRSRLSAAGIML